MGLVDLQRVARARGLIRDDGPIAPHSLATSFDQFTATAGERWRAVQSSSHPNAALQLLSQVSGHASQRFMHVFSRLEMINWLREQFHHVVGPEQRRWLQFGALAIKDFHVDLGSLMDAIAPVVIQATGQIKSSDRTRLPGWASLAPSSGGGYRQELPADVRELLDRAAGGWWRAAKSVRDTVTHREHLSVIFGKARQGTLFQVFDPASGARIDDPLLLHPVGDGIVDFSRYAAWILGDILVFRDDLGLLLAEAQGWSPDGLTGSVMGGDLHHLVSGLDALLAGDTPEEI